MKKHELDPVFRVASHMAAQGHGQRAEDYFEMHRGARPYVDDVLVTEGDAVHKSAKRVTKGMANACR